MSKRNIDVALYRSDSDKVVGWNFTRLSLRVIPGTKSRGRKQNTSSNNFRIGLFTHSGYSSFEHQTYQQI